MSISFCFHNEYFFYCICIICIKSIAVNKSFADHMYENKYSVNIYRQIQNDRLFYIIYLFFLNVL
jgi:hypothetical protein